jgi:hypothetical protein
MTNTMRKVMMVVAVLITSCQVSYFLSEGNCVIIETAALVAKVAIDYAAGEG